MNFSVIMPEQGLFNAWRKAARLAISHRIEPEKIEWMGSSGLFVTTPLPDTPGSYKTHVPQSFIKLAGSVIWHSAPERFALLYQALWRLDRRDSDPLSSADILGRRLSLMAKSVGRDIHKMHAFVRFRELPSEKRRRFAAWFEPAHNTLEPGSSFFVKRFADMDWVIATPHLTARFEAGELSFHSGIIRPNLPEDASEKLWATYFANIFNPARIKLNAMHSEMPKKYWKNLPETRLIPDMLKDAEARVKRMHKAAASTPHRGAQSISTRYRSSMPHAPEQPGTLEESRQAALQCRLCMLCEAATQTVWGEGSSTAKLMFVGEQPGDHEDLKGRPFIGPAGQILHAAIKEAGIDPAAVWLTNAVKHFKFVPTGKQRLHQNPNRQEILHCRRWLGLELAFIKPDLVVALGASAAFALTGNSAPLRPRRGTLETGLHGGPVMISWHPSAILREKDVSIQQHMQSELHKDIAASSVYSLNSEKNIKSKIL